MLEWVDFRKGGGIAMSANIPGWSPEIERGFKEILFRFLEEIQCTRAALYLYGPEEKFLLATQYGFGRRDVLAIEHGLAEPMVRRVRDLNGVPAAFNRKHDLGPLTDYLKSAGNSKLLLVPLIAGEEIIGFVDARDKGRKRTFERTDVSNAKKIAAAMVDFAKRSGFVFSDEEIEEPKKVVAAPQEPVELGPPRAPMLDESGLENVHDAALDAVLDHQVLAVAVTLATADDAATLVNLREGSSDFDRDALIKHQGSALVEAGIAPPDRGSWHIELRRVPTTVDPGPSPMIASAVLLESPTVGSLTASVISGGGANAARTTLTRLQTRAEDAREKSALRFSRRCLARRLLQPGARTYPDLVAHSEAVSRLVFSMAKELELGPARAEEAALAGLLHDVGMRELDYERLYRASSPSADDRVRFQKHPVVGERILEGTGLEEVMAAVRHHHERWDGTGNPDRLAREDIPFLARLVHVAEVYDVLTVPGRYRPTVSPERAFEIIERGKSHQFDPQMVEVLGKVVQ
jgi:putative nucleotidyltransferase with HDIG domain